MLPLTQSAPSGAWPDAWLIQVLLDRAVISQDDMEAILDARERSAWLACTQSGVATDESILAALSGRFAIPQADLNELDPDACNFLKEEFARAHAAAPIRLNGRVLEVATSDPLSPSLQSEIGFACGRRTRLFLVSPQQLDDLLERLYPTRDLTDALVTEAGACAASESRHEAGGNAPEREQSLVKLVDALIAQAIRDHASDIYLDPDPLGLSVRFRIDGVLFDMQRLPAGVSIPLAQRLKVMASLDIADRLHPQDGLAHAQVDGQSVELRISTLPVRGRGETVAIRILDSKPVSPALPAA